MNTRSSATRIASGVECDVTCVACLKPVPWGADHIVLDPCAHQLCCRCALSLHDNRGSLALSCPCCEAESLGHYFYSNRNLYDAMVVYKDPKEKSYDEKTIRMKYSLNYLWQEKKDVIDSLKTNEDEKGCAIVLYAAKITKQKGKQRLDQIKTLVKAISWNGDDPPDEDYCHGLQEFCAFLHPNIATPSITPYAHIQL